MSVGDGTFSRGFLVDFTCMRKSKVFDWFGGARHARGQDKSARVTWPFFGHFGVRFRQFLCPRVPKWEDKSVDMRISKKDQEKGVELLHIAVQKNRELILCV